ncbi:hypothetical protein DA2_1016 [Desulfovibrio sp. A2]|nr:hypothetical protein DA2_1016 [Desulfovibrio sp. A2]
MTLRKAAKVTEAERGMFRNASHHEKQTERTAANGSRRPLVFNE